MSQLFRCVLLATCMASCLLLPDRGICFAEETNESMRVYQEHWPKAQSALAGGNYELARGHLEKVASVLPYEPSCRVELARCLARLGATAAAFDRLHEAARYGWNDSERLQAFSELQPLRDAAEFASVLDEVQQCESEQFVAYRAAGISANAKTPLIIYLHGLGIGPRAEIPYWTHVADRLQLTVVCPKSERRFAPMLFGWNQPEVRDSHSPEYFDVAMAKQVIAESIQFAKNEYAIDEDRILLAGFSQGAGVAVRVLLEDPSNYQGGVLIGGLYQPVDSLLEHVSHDLHPEFRLIAGEVDPLKDRSERLAQELRAAGLNCSLKVIPGVGHEYPPSDQATLRKAVADLLNAR